MEFLKQLRTNKKISITKNISKVKSMIENNEQIYVLQQTVNVIRDSLSEARTINDQMTSLDSEGGTNEKKWINELEQNTQDCILSVEAYVKEKECDTEQKMHDACDKLGFISTKDQDSSIDIIKRNKADNFNTRMKAIESLMKSKASSKKIMSLSDKLKEILNDTKNWWISLQLHHDQWFDHLEQDVDMCLAEIMEYVDEQGSNKTRDDISALNSNESCNQIKRVELPKFEGDKSQYFNWKAIFMACIDSTSISAEIKLLHLRQYLGGQALKSIEGLGHSEQAYLLALETLEHKYGGKRRQTTLYLEQVEKFPVLRNEKLSELERYSDLLNLLISNLEESNRTEELGNGVLYIQLQKKLPKPILSDYHRWIYESKKNETVRTLKEFILLETKFRTTASETVSGIANFDTSQENSHRSYQTHIKCKICSKSHDISNCTDFRNMTGDQRWNKVRRHRLCYSCLKPNHEIRNCDSDEKCGMENCEKSHHTLLHHAMELQGYHAQEIHKETIIAMRTVPIIVHHGGKQLNANAILDDGSSQTFVNLDVIKALGIKECNKRNVAVGVLNGKTSSIYTSDVEFHISDNNSEKMYKINAMTTKNVVGDMQVINWEAEKKQFSHLKDISFPKTSKQGKIDILIGVDHPYLHQSIHEAQGAVGEPIARLTPLGWTCVGKTPISNKQRISSHFTSKISMFVSNQQDIQDINNTLKKFWEFEEVGIEEKLHSPNDKKVLEETKKSFKKSNDGVRYEVGVPWKDNKHLLKNNYSMAFRRLQNTEMQLVKRSEVHDLYQSTIEQYIKKNYIRKVPKDEIDKTSWYLPHFPVIRLDKETSKVRIVFDASAPYKGLSLNETIQQGPNLQQDLLKVLIRFRRKPVALVCDIQEMYLQVQIPECDRKYFRFLWRDVDQSKEPCVFEFQRVIFGGNASPFQAQYVSRENAKIFQSQYPRAAETVLLSTYMDDSLDSIGTPKEGIELYHDSKKLWGKAGMQPQKWLSNSVEVLQEIPEKERAKNVEIAPGYSKLPVAKTLGLVWDAQNDAFLFKVNIQSKNCYTKRSFLRITASIFDPLGFLCPFIVRAKIIMQTLWIKKLDWDEKLDDESEYQIKNWMEELNTLNDVCIMRCITPRSNEALKTELHIFVDASEKAIAAAAYNRTLCNNNSIDVRLICAKTKVAPLHAVSMPRLELLGAELGSLLGEKILSTLEVNRCNVYYWTDSNDVLGWLHNRSKLFKPFVAHRVSEIQQRTENCAWMKVPSNCNPVDIATRGSKASDIVLNHQWTHGPTFLQNKKSEWPVQDRYDTIEVKELKQTKYHSMAVVDVKDKNWGLEPTRFSDWSRLCRVTSWVLRFIENCHRKENKLNGALEFDEIENAQLLFIKKAQEEEFTEELLGLRKNKKVSDKSKLHILCPKLDENGVMRANTRLDEAECLNFNTKYPVILPRGSYITKLIVKKYHENGNHTRGTNATLSDLSTRYWIISAREEIRSWEKECNECKKRLCKPAKQIMAPLPLSRLGKSMKAFDNCGVDFAGPFETKAGRGKVRHKRYLCLFTCMAVRAVHLEIAYSLDTNSFLNAFWRFVNRRGMPSEITSDNGKNFVKGEKEIKHLVNSLSKSQINEKTANKGIKWKFNPPHAPHHGGVFESMIKSAKKAMYSVIRNADVTDEELHTLFTGVEDLLNSRPITYQSASPEDINPLTPNHFLHGQMGGEFAPEIVENVRLVARWKRVQEILRHFWQRWMREWLPSIGQRNKWSSTEQNVKKGDIVLVLWPDSQRGKWPLGKIVDAFPGSDGNVRVVSVLVNGKIYRRGLNTIYPLKI